MKVLIFNPYFDTLGGGELYTLQVIKFFLQRKALVELAWPKKEIKYLVKDRFGIDIEKVKINPRLYKLLKQKNNILGKYKITSKFDLIFFVSDGSIPFLFSKKNLLHFQVPFKNIGGGSWFNQIKLKFINQVICNSFFTKKVIDEEFKIKSEVLHPAFSSEFKPAKKKNLIISVGRFDNLIPTKKQDVLIKIFKKMVEEKKLKKWRLVLVGGVLGESGFVNRLKQESKGYPIEIKENISFSKLKSYYAQAKIYWHATGFGEDLFRYPQKAEHFGISVLEAMAAGCLPIVFDSGGLPEIVQHGKSGFLFKKLAQLESLTLRVIGDKKLYKEVSNEAQLRVRDFSKEKFFKKFDEIIK